MEFHESMFEMLDKPLKEVLLNDLFLNKSIELMPIECGHCITFFNSKKFHKSKEYFFKDEILNKRVSNILCNPTYMMIWGSPKDEQIDVKFILE